MEQILEDKKIDKDLFTNLNSNYSHEFSSFFIDLMKRNYKGIKNENELNRKLLKKSQNDLIKILSDSKPWKVKQKEISNILKQSGIAIVYYPYVKRSGVLSFSDLHSNKATLFISDYKKREYQFIFSLFQEIERILTVSDSVDKDKLSKKLTKLMKKNNVEHKELLMSFDSYRSFQSGASEDIVFEELRVNTKIKVNFGNVEKFFEKEMKKLNINF